MPRQAIASDDFNRASLGSNWSQVGVDVIEIEASTMFRGGSFFTDIGSGWATARWAGSGSFTDNQYAKCTVQSITDQGAANGGGSGVVVRASADTNPNDDFYYAFVASDGANGATHSVKVGKVVNGTHTSLATRSSTYSNGDTIELEAIGTTLRVYRNGVQLGADITDTSLATGVPGVISLTNSGAGNYGDNWEGGNVTTFTLDQYGFRWGVDDGAEGAHGWEAAENTNITIAAGQSRLLRVGIDAVSGDPDAIAYTLKARKNGSGGYVAVPVGPTTTTSPPAAPTATVTTIGTATDPWSINRPAASAGDLIVFVIAWDDSTDVTSVTAPAGVNSETAVSIAGPQASASTEMRVQAWYYIASGAWTTGTLSFDPSASETCRAVAFVIPAGQFKASDPIGFANTRASAGTAESNVLSPTGTAEADDGSGRLYIAFGSDVDALTAPGSDWNTINNATGGGVGLLVGSRNTLVSNSESIAALTATIASDSWATLCFVVKPNVANNEVYITASANIAAGGEATTARLTPPSGKTTGDFVTGRRWDDENGSDSIDIAADDYTELEWLVALAGSLNAGDYFDFQAHESATVTPRWTIASDANQGDVAASSQAAAISSAGVRRVIGSGAVSSQPAATSVAGHKLLDGDVAMQAQAHALAIDGDIITGHLGDAAMASQAAEIDADGVRRSVDVGEGVGFNAGGATLGVVGTRRIVGGVGAVSAAAAASILGPRLIPCDGALQAQAAALGASGVRRVRGDGPFQSAAAAQNLAGARRITGQVGAIPAATTVAISGARVRNGGVIMASGAHALSIIGDVGGQISGVLTPAASAALLAVSGLRRVMGDLEPDLAPTTFEVDGILAGQIDGDLAAMSPSAETVVIAARLLDGGVGAASQAATILVIQGAIGYLTGSVRFRPALTGRPQVSPGDA